MSLSSLELFIFGAVTGIVGIILTLLYGFDVLVKALQFVSYLTGGGGNHKDKEAASFSRGKGGSRGITSEEALMLLKEKRSQDKRSLREQGLEGLTGSVSLATPLRLVSTCTLTWYEEGSGACGLPVECRLSLTGDTVSIFELLPTRKGVSAMDGMSEGYNNNNNNSNSKSKSTSPTGLKGNLLFAEHLKGKMPVCRLSVEEFKKFGKAGSTAPANNNNNNNNTSTSNRSNAAMTSADYSTSKESAAGGYGRSGTSNSAAANPIAPVFHGKVLHIRSNDNRPLFASPIPPSMNGSGGSSVGRSSSVDSVDNLSVLSDDPYVEDNPLAANMYGDGGAKANMATWTSMIVKFSSLRDQERWLTLLRCVEEADAWREFAKNIPNPDTFNLFASRFLFQNFSGNGLAELIAGAIRKKLKKVSYTKFPRDLEGDILLDDFVIGNALPWISEVSEPTLSTNGEFGFDFNIQYKGGEEAFVLYFRLALSYRGIRIPHVVFSVKLLELEGTAHISIGPPPSTKFWIGGHKPPVLRLEVRQGGAAGKGLLHRVLTSLPDLSETLTNLIKIYLFSDMILPFMDDFPLPSVEAAPKTRIQKKNRTFDRKRAAAMSGAQPTSSSSSPDRRSPLDSNNNNSSEKVNTTTTTASGMSPVQYQLPTALQGGGGGSPSSSQQQHHQPQKQPPQDRLSDTDSISSNTKRSDMGASTSLSRRQVNRNLKEELKEKGKEMDASGQRSLRGKGRDK